MATVWPTDMELTENEKAFLAAARTLMEREGRDDFCYVDICLHGYAGNERTARATLGSLVSKRVLTAPVDGWSSLLVQEIG